MNRYLLSFYKKGNMRFISHLDLQTLFHRAIRRGGVDVAYSNGYNPHELMNIVQPLSLGYEGLHEYLELDTEHPYDCEDLKNRMNIAMPEGIAFFDCEELERANKSTSCPTKAALYEASYDNCSELSLDIEGFLNRESVLIFKRDKKTKKMVEKDVKEMINRIILFDDKKKIFLDLSCGHNATVNPSNLIAALFAFSGTEYKPELLRITRTELVRA